MRFSDIMFMVGAAVCFKRSVSMVLLFNPRLDNL